MPTNFSRGMFICDLCDAPVNQAKHMVLRPKDVEIAKLPTGTRVETVELAFCEKCCKDTVHTSMKIREASEKLNAWLKSVTQ